MSETEPGKPTQYAVKPPSPAKAAPRSGQPPRGPAAILVAHGMGQQVEFQTLDDVAEGLRAHEHPRPQESEKPKPVASTVVLGDQRMQRLELKVCLDGDNERSVHVYEAYWAPLTAGRVTLRDVTGFFIRSGLAGIRMGRKPFSRWLFGTYTEFPAPIRTVFYLLLALSVIVALGFLSTLIVGIAVVRAPMRDPPGWLSDTMFHDVTTVLNVLVVCMAPFAATMVWWVIMQKRSAWRAPGWLSLLTFVLALWATLAAATTAAIVVIYHVAPGTGRQGSFFDRTRLGPVVPQFNSVFDDSVAVLLVLVAIVFLVRWCWRIQTELNKTKKKDPANRSLTLWVRNGFILLVLSQAALALYFGRAAWRAGAFGYGRHGLAWPLVVAAAAAVRWFLIEYAGDVAAYIQPQVVDRFFELRKEIKNVVWRAARAVYEAPDYEDIILVGHSLGSVVMYDVLNRLFIDKALGGGRAPEVADRTRLLLTFGSPLDKTAFLFGLQGTGTEAREAIAASLQPLITDESARPVWVNIYSPWDIISGPLDYYDRPERTNRNAVKNVLDRQATTLLAAHVEYWQNPEVYQHIIQALA